MDTLSKPIMVILNTVGFFWEVRSAKRTIVNTFMSSKLNRIFFRVKIDKIKSMRH